MNSLPTSPTAAGTSRRDTRPPLDFDLRIPALSLVMPAYDEEAGIEASIAEAAQVLQELAGDWEMVVVDDGSTDRTAALVAARGERDPRIRLLRRPHEGYGPALAAGLREARLDVVAYTDADAQFDLHDLRLLHQQLGDVDMVAGYRVQRQDPLLRRFSSFGYGLLVRAALGIGVRDVNCALKMWRRDALQRFDLQSGGFLIDAEIYARARQLGIAWRQVPVRHRPRVRGSSSVRLGTVTQTLRELRALRRLLRR